jgi:hypothetical protein
MATLTWGLTVGMVEAKPALYEGEGEVGEGKRGHDVQDVVSELHLLHKVQCLVISHPDQVSQVSSQEKRFIRTPPMPWSSSPRSHRR